MPESPQERHRDLDRFLTFIDAIVAIAITLLVLPLVDVASKAAGEPVSRLLGDHSGEIWAFFLSFAVIANLWLAQHRTLSSVVVANDALHRLLLLWTLTIVVLPFPTALVSSHAGSDRLTKTLYVGTMAVSALVLTLVAVVVRRDRSLRDSEDAPDAAHSAAVFAALLVSLAVMLAVPAASYWPLLLLFLPDRMVRLWHARRAR